MDICAKLQAAGPRLRAILASPEGRALADAIDMTPASLAGLVASGSSVVNALCDSGPAADAAARLDALLGRRSQGTPRAGMYESCRVIVDDDGTTRVICPEQTPAGECGCGKNPPKCPPTTTGNGNCLPSDPHYAPCTVANICTSYKYAPFTASWAGAPLAVGADGEPAFLVQRVTTTRYMITILPIGVASKICLDSISIVSGPLATPVAVPAAALGFQCSRLHTDPAGVWVWAWDTASWIYAPKLTITDGRCQCPPGAMCCCQTYDGPVRFIVDLVKAPLDTDTTTFTVSFTRENCGEAQCGPCPPGPLCGLTLLHNTYLNTASVDIGAHTYLWGAGLPPQEPILRYT